MKTRLLIIIAAFLLLIPWVRRLEFGLNNQVMVDGITVSASIFMTIVIVFSLMSWFLFSWASENIFLAGFLLSVIAGASLAIPFLQVMGPIAGVIVGVVAGFAATVYSSFVLFLPTEPPMMRPIEGIDSVFFMYCQEFLLGGIIGMFVTIGEVISFWKERTGKRDMIKRK